MLLARRGDDRDRVALRVEAEPGLRDVVADDRVEALRASFSRARSSAPSPCSAAKPTSVWPVAARAPPGRRARRAVGSSSSVSRPSDLRDLALRGRGRR